MNCDCSVNVDEHPDVYREKIQTARKIYKCCECGQIIAPGQKYHYVFGVWGRILDTYRTCLTCYRIREQYCPRGFYFETLRETLEECLGFDYVEVPDEEDES